MVENNDAIYVDNIVTIKKNGKDETIKHKQRVTLETDEHFTHAIEFSGSFENEEGTGKVSKPILSINKAFDGSYLITLKRPDLFKSGEKSLLDYEGLTAPIDLDGKSILLNMDANNSKIIASTKGEELTFEIAGEDGKKYVIKTSATKISVEYDGQTFDYDTKGESVFDVSFARETIEDFLDSKNKVCQTPSNINTKFPNYLIGMYGRTLKGNTQSRFGDYTLTTVDMVGDNQSQPYLFVTKEKVSANGKVNQTTYLYTDGTFKEVTEFICQYKKNGDKQTEPCFVLSVKDKKDTMKYYALPIELKDGKLPAHCVEAFKNLKSISNYNDKAMGGEVAYEIEGKGLTINAFARDSREYAQDYRYSEKPKNSIISEEANNNDDDEGNGDGAGAGGDGATGGGDSAEDSNSGNSGNEAPQAPTEQRPAPQETENEEEKKPSPEPEEAPKEKEVKLKGFVEGISNIAMYAGIFLAIGAMLTGIGILATIGLAVTAGGLVGTQVADKFVWKLPIRKAKNKIKQYETEQLEEESFEESFISQEQKLESALEKSAQYEAAFKTLLESDRPAIQNFVEAYNEYGVGFEAIDGAASLALAGMYEGGFERKAAMHETISKITSTTNPEKRNELINQFINENFMSMPQATENAVRDLFKHENREDLKTFQNSLKNVVVNQRVAYTLYEEQKRNLGKATDKQICKVVQSSKLTSEKRKNLVERYSPVILRHFAADTNVSQEKIKNLTENLSADDKTQTYESLLNAQNLIENRIKNVNSIAKANRLCVDAIQDCGKYIKTTDQIKNLEKVANITQIEKESFEFIKNLTAKKYVISESTKSNINNVKASVQTMEATNASEIQLKNILTEIISLDSSSEAQNVTEKYKNIVEESMASSGAISSIANQYVNGTAGKLNLPPLDKPTVESNYTIDKLAERFSYAGTIDFNAYTQSVKALNEKLTNYIPQLDNTLSVLDSNVGFTPTLDEKDIEKEVNQLKSYVGFKTLSEENQKKVAIIYIKAKQIKNVESKTPEIESAEKSYEQAIAVLDLINNKQLFSYVKNSAIHSALGVDGKSVDFKADAKKLNDSIDSYKKIIKIIKSLKNESVQTTILSQFNSPSITTNLKNALLEILDSEYATKEYDTSGVKYKEVLNAVTKDGKIDLKKATKKLQKDIDLINAQTKTRLTCMNDVLGAGFTTAEYKRRVDDAKNNRREADRFDTIFEYVAYKSSNHIEDEEERLAKYNETLKNVRQAYANKKFKSEAAIFKRFGINKKELKEARKNLKRTYSKRSAKKIGKAEIKLDTIKDQVTEFNSIWSNALNGNLDEQDKLRKWLGDENKELLFFGKLGLNRESMIEAVNSSKNPNEVAKALAMIEDNDHVIAKNNIIIKNENEKVQTMVDSLTLPTRNDRKLAKLENQHDKLETNCKILNAKIKEIFSSDLTNEQIKAALSEFADENLELIEDLGLNTKLFKGKGRVSKKHKKLTQLSIDFEREMQNLEKSIKAFEAEATKEDKGTSDLNKKDSTKVKDNVSMLGRIIDKLFTKHKEEVAAQAEEAANTPPAPATEATDERVEERDGDPREEEI